MVAELEHTTAHHPVNATPDELPRRFLFSVDEYHKLAETNIFQPDERIELIEGEIVMMCPVGRHHAAGVKRTMNAFRRLSNTDALLSVQDPLALPGSNSEPLPDVMLLAPRADFYEDELPQPTDVLLLVEVADSTLSFDRKVKLPLYARYGVRESWILNLVENVLEVYTEPKSTGYAFRRIAMRGESVTPQVLPHLKVRVADLLGKKQA